LELCEIDWILENGNDAGDQVPPGTKLYWEGDFWGRPQCWRVLVVDNDGDAIPAAFTFGPSSTPAMNSFFSPAGDTSPDHVKPAPEEIGKWTVMLQWHSTCVLGCTDKWITLCKDVINIVPVTPAASLAFPIVGLGILTLKARRQ
jgi:hypothetical protein